MREGRRINFSTEIPTGRAIPPATQLLLTHLLASFNQLYVNGRRSTTLIHS